MKAITKSNLLKFSLSVDIANYNLIWQIKQDILLQDLKSEPMFVEKAHSVSQNLSHECKCFELNN